MATPMWATCSATSLTKDILKMISDRKTQMIDWFTKPRSQCHSKEDSIPQPLSLTTSLYTTTTSHTSRRMRTMCSDPSHPTIGGTTTLAKRDSMALSPPSLSTLRRAKRKSKTRSKRKSGCNCVINLSPNFNGTSKNFVETLSRPCPAPSQLTLNQLRNAKPWF